MILAVAKNPNKLFEIPNEEYFIAIEICFIMKKIAQHIIKNPDGGWVVRKQGSSKATKVYNTKDAAVEEGKKIAKNQGATLYIHGKEGKILTCYV